MDKRFVVYIVARYWLLVPIFRGLVRLSALYVFGLRYYFLPSSPPFPPIFFFLHYTYVRAIAILQNRRCTLFLSLLDWTRSFYRKLSVISVYYLSCVRAGQGIAHIVSIGYIWCWFGDYHHALAGIEN